MKVQEINRDGFVPLHGLAPLGAGGLTVSLYVWLLFLTPHPQTPVPIYETLSAFAASGSEAWWFVRGLQVGIGLFAAIHLCLVFWMLRGLFAFKHSEAYLAFKHSHNGVQWMVRPLVLAMMVNVLFILGMVFFPRVWDVREFLFPVALISFALIGIDALKIWSDHLSELYEHGADNAGSGLAGMFPAFTFAMVAVGFSASAAMSHDKVTAGIGFIGAVLLIVFALFISTAHFIVQFPAMIREGVKPAASGTLWMAIPISTVLGIAVFRLMMSAQHVWNVHVGSILPALALLIFVSVQVFFYLVGRTVMRRNRGWDYLVKEQPQAASFSLICPGVGAFVLGMFVVFKALLPLEVVKVDTRWIPLLPLLILQLATIGLFLRLLLAAMPKKVSFS